MTSFLNLAGTSASLASLTPPFESDLLLSFADASGADAAAAGLAEDAPWTPYLFSSPAGGGMSGALGKRTPRFTRA